MSNMPIDRQEVKEAAATRRTFWIGVYRHFLVYLAVNVLIWLLWLLIPNMQALPPIPWVITGGWTIILLVHALIVFLSHNPRQAAQAEVQRQVQEKQVMEGRR